MGSSRQGGLLLRRAPLRMEDPRAGTSGFKESTPCVISYNKGQCNERLAQAVWARVIAKRRLAREVGSEEKKQEGLSQQPARDWLETAAGAAAPCRGSSSNQTTFLSRDVPLKQLRHIGVHCVITHSTDTFIQSIHLPFILEYCFPVLAGTVGD